MHIPLLTFDGKPTIIQKGDTIFFSEIRKGIVISRNMQDLKIDGDNIIYLDHIYHNFDLVLTIVKLIASITGLDLEEVELSGNYKISYRFC